MRTQSVLHQAQLERGGERRRGREGEEEGEEERGGEKEGENEKRRVKRLVGINWIKEAGPLYIQYIHAHV